MSRAASSARQTAPASSTPKRAPSLPKSYLDRSQLPLASLVFLLPFIILYEVGTRWYTIDPVSHVDQQIRAFTWMQHFFVFFGATGKFLPAMAVVGILLCCHIVRNDPWAVQPGTLVAMAVESIALALPLLVIGPLLVRYMPLHTASSVTADWRAMIVLSVGAGIYEELVFRLAAFALLSLILADVFRLKKSWVPPLIVILSAILFSAYHYLGTEAFQWPSFVFRTLAGLYFGGIFLLRGFGITAGAHAAYDVILVLFGMLAGR